jgi:hypothetical protein
LNGHEMFSFYRDSLGTLHGIKTSGEFTGSRGSVVTILIILWPISFVIGYIIYGVVLGYSLIFFRRKK